MVLVLSKLFSRKSFVEFERTEIEKGGGGGGGGARSNSQEVYTWLCLGLINV